MRFSIAVLPALIAAPGFAEPPKVVADIPPVHALLSQVMEGVATPDLLLAQGDNPHSVQLKPSQVRMLAGADLVVWVGPDLSPWLESVLENEADAEIALLEHPATHLRAYGEVDDADAHEDGADHAEQDHDEHDHDEQDHDDHDHDDHDDHADDDHDHDEHHDHHEHDEHDGHDGEESAATTHDDHAHAHDGVDPHAWLSTVNAREWIGVFADRLAEMDPDNASVYAANAAKATAGIDALDAQIEGRLAAHAGAQIVTFHDSFGYFADQFGIEIGGTVRPGDASAPSAAAMDTLRDLVADHGIECAFAEPGFDPGLLDAIAGGTGLRIGMLDPRGTLQPVGPGHYTASMTAVAEAIADCLDGA